MGADIHSFYETKLGDKWVKQDKPIFPTYNKEKTASPFNWRSYGMFGFLANVRNYSMIPLLAEPEGLPDDSEYLNEVIKDGFTYSGSNYTTRRKKLYSDYYHSFSYFTLRELLDFDYNQTFEDRRTTKTTVTSRGVTISNGGALAEEGEGNVITYREFLGESYFRDLEILKTVGKPDEVRIVFWFDN